MTRLLFLFIATLTVPNSEPWKVEKYPVDLPCPIPSEPHDPLAILADVDPKDTLSYYLNNLTNYIYDTDIHAGADPRAAFFTQEHQLRIYETLNEYVEKNYGSTLRYILYDDYRSNLVLPLQIKEKYIGKIIELEEKVAEMFMKVIYGSGDKSVNQERLEQVQKKIRKLVYTFGKFATFRRMMDAYNRLKEIHLPVLENFNNTAYGDDSRVKRGAAPFNDTKLQEELTASLKNLTSYVYGAPVAELLSTKISVYIQPLGSLISFQRFLEANYRKYLNQVEKVDYEERSREDEIKEIKKIEQKTTVLLFEVISSENLDLLKNRTIIDEINAAISKRVDDYIRVRSLEEIRETNRKIHEVYGHLFKDCDQSSYLNIVKLIDHYHIREFPELSEPEDIYARLHRIGRIIENAEAKWQWKHKMSSDENKRIRKELSTVGDIGLHFLESTLKRPCDEEEIDRKIHTELHEPQSFKRQPYNETTFELIRSNKTSLEPTFG